MKPRALRTIGMVAVTAVVVLFGGAPVAFAAPQVTICHATNSDGNAYVEHRVAESSIFKDGAIVVNGHGTHTGLVYGSSTPWGDIIPAFGAYPGLNATAGKAWLDRHCNPAPVLTLVKKVINNSVGTQPATAWILKATTSSGSTVLSGATGSSGSTGAVLAGTYKLDESGPDGYSASAWTCTSRAKGSWTLVDSALVVGKADVDAVTCTIKNTFLPPTETPVPGINIKKTATLNDVIGSGHTALQADVGETIKYSFTVTNTGNVALSAVTVTDLMVGTVTCLKTSLPVGESTTCDAPAYPVTQADVDKGGVISNTATAVGTYDGGQVSDEDTADVPVAPAIVPRAAINVVKTATLHDSTSGTAGKADEGETISYSFLVTNSGNVTLSDVTVDDPRLNSVVSCEPNVLDPGESVTCTPAADYTVTKGDVANGEAIVNTATAAGQPEIGPEVTDTDQATTPTKKPSVAPSGPSISVVKTYTLHDSTSGTAGKADAGETIDYSFVVTNTGNVKLLGVAVADAMLDAVVGGVAVTCPQTDLNVGASTTCSAATYLVTSRDVAAGQPIVNVAIASGSPASQEGKVDARGEVSTPTQKPNVVTPPTPPVTPVTPVTPVVPPIVAPIVTPVAPPPVKAPVVAPVASPIIAPIVAPVVTPGVTPSPTLAFTGAETIPLGLSGLMVLLLGVLLTIASRHTGRHRATE